MGFRLFVNGCAPSRSQTEEKLETRAIPGARPGNNEGRSTMAVVGQTGNTAIQVTEGSGATYVIVIALLILFGTAAYFTGRLFGTTGLIVCGVGFLATVGVLYMLGGIGFS
jgi:hypothetical protein